MHNLVPHFILTQHDLGKHIGTFDAAALFVDISGFTTITETLMQYGTVGAETLANLMRATFTPLIDRVYAHGGFIVGFAGDAFTAVFPTQLHTTTTEQIAATDRALAAAIAIQHTVLRQDIYATPYGNFSISSKIGVDYGNVEWGIINNRSQTRAAYYFRGAAIDGCSQAEHQANRGDLIISTRGYTAVSTHIPTQQLNQYYRVLPSHTPFKITTEPFSPKFQQFSALSTQYYPLNVINQTHFGEFRQVINVFIGLAEALSATELKKFIQLVFKHQQIYDGFLNRIDFGDKGCNLLLFWGAPTAHENDIHRALNFLLDLQSSSGMTFRAAVTYTIAFAGFVGSDMREEYTCYGRGINLAARLLMQADWGEIWVDSAIAQRATPQFSVDFIDQFIFKGFAEAQSVFALQAHRLQIAKSLFRGKMVGRQQELAQLHQ
ncbi:MAG: hypothetical protein GY943_00255, partial [Chloroflexi bacterium]|nr:hypothetical protein [Chloroflexota bacterium]